MRFAGVKLLAFVLVLIISSANGQSGNEKRYTKGGVYFKVYNPEKNEFYIVPKWFSSKKDYTDTRIDPVNPEDYKDWLKSFNHEHNNKSTSPYEELKGTKLEFLRFVKNDKQAIILGVAKEGEDLKKDALAFNFYPNLAMLYDVFNTPFNFVATVDNKSLAAFKDTIRCRIAAENGNAKTLYLDEGNTGTVTGYYSGDIRQQLPNGHGTLILSRFVQDSFPYSQREKIQIADHRLVNYKIFNGWWANGSLKHQEIFSTIENQVIPKLNLDKISNDYTVSLMEASYMEDDFVPDLPKEIKLKWLIRMNIGNTPEFLIFSASYDDYTLSQVKVNFDFSTPRFESNFPGYRILFPKVRENIKSDDVVYDNYLKYDYETDYEVASFVPCRYENIREYNYYLERDVTKSIPYYPIDKYYYLKFRYRKSKNDSWNPAANYTITGHQTSCSPDIFTYKWQDDGSSEKSAVSFNSYNAALNEVIRKVKIKFPSPDKDTTQEFGTKSARLLTELIEKHLRKSSFAIAGSDTSMNGIWADRARNIYYFIQGQKLKMLPLEAFEKQKYLTLTEAVQRTNMDWKNRQYFEIKTADLNCPSCADKTTGFQIKSRTKDIIYMEDDIRWERIVKQ